jgi:hypothetical protein
MTAEMPAAPRAGRALFWLVLIVAAYFIPRGNLANPDSHLALTYALVERHTVRIDAYARHLLDKAVYCGPSTDVRRCTHLYTDKAPGMSLLAAAAYAPLRLVITPPAPTADRFLLRLLITLLAVSLPCAIFIATYWRFLTRFVEGGAAMLTTLGYALGSMALPFSMLLFSHAVSAALLFWAFMLLHRASDCGPGLTLRCHGRDARLRSGDSIDRGGPRAAIGPWLVVVAGALAGYAIGCEYPTALIAALLGIYALAGSGSGVHRLGVAARYGVGLAIGLLPAAVYNTVAFGTPYALGYGHLTDPYYAHGMAHGIFGIGWPSWQSAWGASFSPYRGLFVLSPWLLLAAPGLVRMKRAGLGAEALICLSISLVYFLFEIGYAFWDGGASVGPRHFLPALPFLAFPTAFAFERHALRRLGVMLVAISGTIMLLVVATNPLFGDPRYVPHIQNPLVDQTLRDLADGRFQNNWGMLFHLPGLTSLIPLMVVLVLLGWRLCRGSDWTGAASRLDPQADKQRLDLALHLRPVLEYPNHPVELLEEGDDDLRGKVDVERGR